MEEETKSTGPKCCDRPDLINDSHLFCTYYGTVNDYLTANELVDFCYIYIENKKKICLSSEISHFKHYRRYYTKQ